MGFLYGLYRKMRTLSITNQPPIHPHTGTLINGVLGDDIRILSYNIQGLFAFYNTGRLSHIVDWIYRMFQQGLVDIVCLQEVFELDLYNMLYAICNRRSLYISHPLLDRKYKIGENSGLVIISRTPISNPMFFEYTQSSQGCRFARKGAYYVQVQEANGRTFDVINTHLQSEDTTIAMSQFRSIVSQLRNPRSIIIGDMNMPYSFVMKHIVTEDVKCANVMERVTYPCRGEQLDYMFICGKNDIFVDTYDVLYNVCLSDHYPIIVTISMHKHGSPHRCFS